MRRDAQLQVALESKPLRRAANNSATSSSASFTYWTENEDRALFSKVWSGATGEAKCLPGRSPRACTERLKEIKKHVDKKDKDHWTTISRAHKHAPRLVETLNTLMEDVDWYVEVQREREKRAAAADEQPPASEPHVAAPIIAVNCALRLLDVCTRVAHATSDQIDEAAACCMALDEQLSASRDSAAETRARPGSHIWRASSTCPSRAVPQHGPAMLHMP